MIPVQAKEAARLGRSANLKIKEIAPVERAGPFLLELDSGHDKRRLTGSSSFNSANEFS
jgi:hypothetical protein